MERNVIAYLGGMHQEFPLGQTKILIHLNIKVIKIIV